MARSEIIDKLDKVLREDIVNEYQVVYILSRIRKILELENYSKEYKFLKFYCNWALHIQIDRTGSISSELFDLENGIDNGIKNFEYFKIEMKKFLNKNELPTKIIEEDENYDRLKKLLIDIYKDTPLTINYPKTINVF